MVGDNSFSKTICSICYEDLKPIVEDLQSISICGHVFHELCLQQWFEYCLNSTKKYSCPVCKQKCAGHNATRLYFQSIGDQSDLLCSQKLIDREQDAEELRSEVKRLLIKISGLSSGLEHQEKKNKEISEELCICKEQIKKETTLKNDALREKALIQQKLNIQSEELSKSNSECSRLEQRIMAVAKELALHKLVFNLDLEQDEILKLASLGNEANSQDTIDNLIRSLASHKKSYKELMAKCNLLGRSEARLQKKLEKAKGKIDKLNTRIQELETSIEVKDNDILRALKASKKPDGKGVVIEVDDNSGSSMAKSSREHQAQQCVPSNNLNLSGISPKETPFLMNENMCSGSCMFTKDTKESSSIVVLDEECNRLMGHGKGEYCSSSPNFKCRNEHNIVQKSATSILKAVSDVNGDDAAFKSDRMVEISGLRTCLSTDRSASLSGATNPMFNIKTEVASSVPLSEQENICFSGGLLGPDGTKRHLGKWCKRSKMQGSMPIQASTKSGGDLIAVGADGRGGKIKVMRSMYQSSLDDKENSTSAKRLKNGAKANSLQSQGCLQIEHFFGKARY